MAKIMYSCQFWQKSWKIAGSLRKIGKNKLATKNDMWEKRQCAACCGLAAPQSPVDSQWRGEEPIRVKLSSRGQHRAAHALVISADNRLCISLQNMTRNEETVSNSWCSSRHSCNTAKMLQFWLELQKCEVLVSELVARRAAGEETVTALMGKPVC